MSVCILHHPWALLYDGNSISFLITSGNLAMEYHFIQREGNKITTDRFILVKQVFNAPNVDGSLGLDVDSIFLL